MANLKFEIHNSRVEVKEKVVVVEFPIARLAEVITFLRRKENKNEQGDLNLDGSTDHRTRGWKESHSKKKIVRRSWELDDVLKAKELLNKDYTATEICKDPFMKARHPQAGIYALARAYILAAQGNTKNSYSYSLGPKVMSWIDEQLKTANPTILGKYLNQ